MINLQKIFEALVFASWQHRLQRRKGNDNIPYINHPIRVASLLTTCNDRQDENLLIAAILHDVLEDTDTSATQLEAMFGKEVTLLVEEVSDDMSLPETVRKQKQIEKAPLLSSQAKQIKIADKICNIQDIVSLSIDWPAERKLEYLAWAKKVVDGCRGVNAALEALFDETFRMAAEKLKKDEIH